jgi:diguanylate cyclase (GGDEF)-like protein
VYPFSLIDPGTLQLIAIGMFLITALFMTLAYRIRDEAAYAWLAGGCAAFSIGWALNASEYVFGTTVWTVPLSHLFLLLLPVALICASISFLRLQGIGAALIMSAPILVTTFFILRVTMHHDIIPSALTSSLNGAMYLGTAWIFNRYAQPANSVAKAIIAANMITGAAFIARTAVLLYGTLAPDAITPEVVRQLLYTTLFINLMCALGQSLCFPLLDFMRSEEALSRTNQHLARLADRDHLTGVYNRRAFRARLEVELEYHQRRVLPLSLIVFDIDHFKGVNDTHGHAAGDAVIRAVVDAIRSQSRKTDVLARYGGDEFTLLLPDTRLEQAAAVADQWRQRISELAIPIGPDKAPLQTTCSFGIATTAPEQADIEGLIAAADAALYEAKRQGRNCVSPTPKPKADKQPAPAYRRISARLVERLVPGNSKGSSAAAND